MRLAAQHAYVALSTQESDAAHDRDKVHSGEADVEGHAHVSPGRVLQVEASPVNELERDGEPTDDRDVKSEQEHAVDEPRYKIVSGLASTIRIECM